MTQKPHRPEAADLVNFSDIATYFSILFDGVGLPGFVNLRGIGEKGTSQEGKFREDMFHPISPGSEHTINTFAYGEARRWAQWSVASFVVPAIMKEERGTSDSVDAMTCMILDLDTDCDTDEARDWLTKHVGEPTMVIRSGGTNGAGSPKRHFYWRMTDGYREIERIVGLRHVLALRAGGDLQFGVGTHGKAIGRAHQPIRIPGTVHAKGGRVNVTALDHYDEDVTYPLGELELKIKAMPPAPWLGAAEKERAERHIAGASMDSLFSTTSGSDVGGGEALLDTIVRSGSQDNISRFDAFSKVAGHFLHVARKGEMSKETAFERLEGWVLANMQPPWPIEKIRTEWRALLTRELRANGPLVEKTKTVSLFSPESAPDIALHLSDPAPEIEIEVVEDGGVETAVSVESPLLAWAAHRWVSEEPIDMPFLVDGLICEGEQHMMAAEGGAGKSFSMIDLGLRIAVKGYEPHTELEWFGQRILRGGTVVLMLNEDSMKTVNNRILRLNEGNMKGRAGDKFIPLPMSSLGGAFTLVDGEGGMSSRWAEFFAALKMIPDLSLVIMDTFSTMLHGSEVDSTIINQMMTQANRLVGETGAAMLWLHHVRKPGEDPIRDAEGMKNAVRGSTAIIGSMRHVIGMWRAQDWERRCKKLNIPPDRDAIWRCAIVKSNLDVAPFPEKTLARHNGRMLDLTEADPYNKGNFDIRGAWLVVAVRAAAQAGYPFSKGGKNDQSGIYKRRSSLPEELNRLGHLEVQSLVEWALQRKLVVACAAKGSGTPKWLDVPNGDYATSSTGATIAKGSWTNPDWDEWLFDAGQNICVKSGGAAGRMMEALLSSGGDE